MASVTGKKSKKSKEKKLSLQDFLATSAPSTGGTTQVAVQKVTSWAEECEDDEDHKKIEFIQLPTAPRATRIMEDSSIPQEPPFYARVSNLPFDINESDLYEFFSDSKIRVKEMRLARDDANDRLRGFGTLEFDTREDLIDAIMLNDPTIHGRRMRLEVTKDIDSFAGRTVRRRFDYGSRGTDGDGNTNWRDRKESNFETVDHGRDRDRGERRNYQSRSNFQNRHDNNSNGGDDTNWRLGERQANDSPPPPRRFGNNDRDRRAGGRYGNDRRDNNRDQVVEERPKLNLQPRTLPLPELNFPKEEEEVERATRKISLNNGDKESHDDSGLAEDSAMSDDKSSTSEAPKPKPVPKEDIFGQAKPVDTAAREKEIEEKIERERQERIQKEKEKQEEAPAEKKDEMIKMQTEDLRRQDWRKKDESIDDQRNDRNRHIGGGGGRHLRNERSFNKDNRDNRNYNNRGMNRDRDRRDGGNRSYGGRDGPRRDNYEAREPREYREPREQREPMHRDMPKFSEDTGPNLKTSNLFAGLDEEVDAD